MVTADDKVCKHCFNNYTILFYFDARVKAECRRSGQLSVAARMKGVHFEHLLN